MTTTTPMRTARAAALTLAATLAATTAAQAAPITIDFESDTQGGVLFVPNGFVSADTAIAQFSDSLGNDLLLGDFGDQSNGVGLAVLIADDSELVIDFTQPVTNLSLSFGNDDPQFIQDPESVALLEGFRDGAQVGEATTLLNLNDALDQSVALPDVVIDQATFVYADRAGTPENIDEVVDDISFELAASGPAVVPVPMALPLLASAFGLVGALRATRRRPAA